MSKDPQNISDNEDQTKLKIEGSRIAPGLQPASNNTIQKPVKKEQKIIYSGSVKAGFGTFNYRWIVKPDGTTELTTLESAGSGDLPAKEKKLFIRINKDGTTKIYQEWFPLLNEKKPLALKYIVDVKTTELFSAFSNMKLPNDPSGSLSQKVQSIKWNKIFIKNNIKYLPGNINNITDYINIAWKKNNNHSPELIAFVKDGTNLKIYILINDLNNTSKLFMEKYFKSDHGRIPYLSYIATVSNNDLMKGFKSAF